MKSGILKSSLLSAAALPSLSAAACISSGDHNTINQALQTGGQGAKVQLCPNAVINIAGQIAFTADFQEISTQGYPTDDSRGILRIQPGNNATTIIAGGNRSNISILNIHLDGNRRNCGYMHTGGANIEIGGLGFNQRVSWVKSEDPRNWSCLHVIGSGQPNNPCTNATITHNDIGPAGQAGTDADGNGLWADGISLDCANSLVQYNTVTGSTDGGIVIFGSPGSLIDSNTITSSATEVGFGAINMVDDEYDGSYAGVVVSNNVMKGVKLFKLGMGIGSDIWGAPNTYTLHGPATIVNNTFLGNIGFAMAINGWDNGLTISNNDVSGVTNDKSSYADASQCSAAVQNLFNKNDKLIYYPAGLTGSQSLQSGFDASPNNFDSLLCTTTPLPNSVSFQAGQLSVDSGNAPIAQFHNGFVAFQGDKNWVVYINGQPVWASGSTLDQGCGNPTQCHLLFGSDGNLVISYQGQSTWSTNTAGEGQTIVFQNSAPWIKILDANGNDVWDTTKPHST